MNKTTNINKQTSKADKIISTEALFAISLMLSSEIKKQVLLSVIIQNIKKK